MHFEPLPVVGQPTGQEDLSRQEALAGRLVAGFGPVQRVAFLGCQLGAERISEMGEQIGSDLLELSAVRFTRGIWRRATAMAAQVDHQREAGHVDGLLDPLTDLRFDALDEAARVVMLVGIGSGGRRLAHKLPQPRRRPPGTPSGAALVFVLEETRGISLES